MKLLKVIEEKESEYNGLVRVVKSLGLGTYLQVGGITQSGGIVEGIWKKTLKVLKKKNFSFKNCLVLGLGGGTVVKLLKKSWPGIKITGVEIDPVMVKLGKKYLDLKEVTVKIGDAADFSVSGYDLVLVDLYCGTEFPKKFESDSFLKKLTKNKAVVFNRLYYGEKRPGAVKLGNKLEKIFKKVDWVYPEANLMLVCYN